MKTILLVESIPLLRNMLCQLLIAELKTSIVTMEYESLLKSLALKPEWIWLDGVNPLLKRQHLLKNLKNSNGTLKIIIFGQDESIADIHYYYQQGIAGYLPKTASQEDIIQMIQCINAGKVFVPNVLLSHINHWIMTPVKKSLHHQLTPREKEVLNLIVEEYSTKEIAEKLFVSPCTIETHRLNLIQKLEVKNTAGLVRKAVQERLWGHWNFK